MSSPENCPECGLDNIAQFDSEIDIDNIYKYYYCSDCGCKWVETYRFLEFEILEREDGYEPL